MKKILFTGLSGFVGQNFLEFFSKKEDYEVINYNRNETPDKQFIGIDIVIHAAGLAHNPEISDRESYIDANLNLTKTICEKCLKYNVKTFIFISTIKVLGEFNIDSKYFTEESPYNPKDFYSESKMLAEKHLISHFKSGLVILRPVLIYGPKMKGNMKSLAKVAHIPLPIKGISAKRSIIFVGNLVRHIENYLNTTQGIIIKNCTDERPLTISEIVNNINKASKSKNRMFYFPGFLIKFFLRLIHKSSIIDRIMRDFVVKFELQNEDLYGLEKSFKLTFREEDEKNI